MLKRNKIFAAAVCAVMIMSQTAFAENVNTVSGFVFYDNDKDGVYNGDKGDYPLANHLIRTAYKESPEKTDSVSISEFKDFDDAFTDEDGKYSVTYPVSDPMNYSLICADVGIDGYTCTTDNSAQAFIGKGGFTQRFDNVGLAYTGELSNEHRITVNSENVCNLQIADKAAEGTEVRFVIKPGEGHKFKNGSMSYSINTKSGKMIELKTYEGTAEPGTNELTEISGTFVMPNEEVNVFFVVNETDLKLRATETEFEVTGDMIKVTYNFNNQTETVIADAVGMAVMYDKDTGRMLDVKTIKSFVPGNNTAIIELPITSGTYFIKTFVWDNEQNVYPYAMTKNIGSTHRVSVNTDSHN